LEINSVSFFQVFEFLDALVGMRQQNLWSF